MHGEKHDDAHRRLTLNRRVHLPAIVLLVLSIGGLGGAVFTDVASEALRRAWWAARNSPDADVLSGFVDGSVTQTFDAHLEAEHPFRTPSVVGVGVVRYLLFRQGNDGVVVGRDGWLFTEEEFRRFPDDSRRVNERTAWIIAATEDLRSRGAATVVVILPSKARVAAGTVPPRLRPVVDHPRLERALRRVSASTARTARGDGPPVVVVDGRTVLEPEHFFLRDTHWTPEGAAVVARRVAETVVEASQGASSWTPPGRSDHEPFSTVRGDERRITGDLMSFVPVGPSAAVWLGLHDEVYVPTTVSGGGGGLFDVPEIPVALVGTSYSADQRWGFDGALNVALQADTVNVADAGRGPFAPMAEYLSGPTITEFPPRVVVWEIPERYLSLPDVPLPPLPTMVLDGAPP